MGKGPILSDLEWDIKAYFMLGGALHDAAIAAWSIKGFYDYIRPISAVRYMSDMGQSSDTTLSNYHPYGMKLVKGLVEIVTEDDPLAKYIFIHLHNRMLSPHRQSPQQVLKIGLCRTLYILGMEVFRKILT